MRFRRWPRPTRFEGTTRKRAALIRKQRLEREALPLFSDQIAVEQPAVDTVTHERGIDWIDAQRERRRDRAARWHDVRRRLFALDGALRAKVHRLWRNCPYPADLSFRRSLASGRTRPHRSGAAALGLPPDNICTDHAEPEALRRSVPQDRCVQGRGRTKNHRRRRTALLWQSRLGNAVLRSRVRLIDPNESFYTCSNHRLRDSYVGRAGHWVDIEVRGKCSDDDLSLIERLARDADAARRRPPRRGARAPPRREPTGVNDRSPSPRSARWKAVKQNLIPATA